MAKVDKTPRIPGLLQLFSNNPARDAYLQTFHYAAYKLGRWSVKQLSDGSLLVLCEGWLPTIYLQEEAQ